jgi:conjugal transfer mating pair stabilization protein TraG
MWEIYAYQATLSGSSSAASVGNTSMGNVAMDQMQLAPNRSSAFMLSWQNDISGDTFSSNALNGRTAVSLLRNQGFASRVVSVRVSEQDVQNASKQVDAARSEAVAANSERSTVLTEAFTKGLAKLRSSRDSSGSTSSGFEEFGESLNRLDQISKSVAGTTGLTQSQVARVALGVSGRAGFNTPFVGVEANATADKNYTSGLSAAEQKALSSISNEQIAAFKQFGDRISHDTSFVSAIATDAREAQELSTRLSSTTARSERADASLAERTTFAERVSSAYERGEAISIDIAQDPHNLEMFTRYAQQYGGNSASARVLMDAELARQSLKPQRVFSDGSAMPAGFDDIGGQHSRDLGNPALNPDVTGRYHAYQGTVRGSGSAMQPSAPAASASVPTELRRTVGEEGQRIRTATSADQTSFDDKARVTKTPDGTLSSDRSLMLQTGKQVGQDAGHVIDNTKQIVKDALKE